ncbi:MAG: hypothetical protein OXL68_00245 [Paracoccaceae bacterium]|nr:hypothetical protein [Paracoccaceae bacterium]
MDPHEAHFNYRQLYSEELAAYADQGFILLNDVLTERGVGEMVDQCMAYWSAEKESTIPREPG